jgi:superfamily II DNA helicase RecQ
MEGCPKCDPGMVAAFNLPRPMLAILMQRKIQKENRIMLPQCEPTNPVLHLRLTEIETRESILEHLKDISEGRLWKKAGHSSLQKYCEQELGYSATEARELLTQIGEIIPASQLISTDPAIQFRIDILKNWRKQKAKALEIPAYQVISNRTLLELAERAPMTEQDLITVYGIGEKKLSAYGFEITSTLRNT